MPDVRNLLPPNRTALESSVVQALFTQEHPIRDITTLYRADILALPLLPWLAWSQDVLVWPADADESMRRNLTAGAWAMHRRMGTLAGLREMAGYQGGTIKRAIVPPSKTYAGVSLTAAERNTFVQRYPQLRIYPQRVTGKRVGAMLAHCFPGAGVHPTQTDATMRLAPQTYLYRDGVETPLQSTERSTISTERTGRSYLEVRRPGMARHGSFAGLPGRWLVPGDAGQRMYRLTVETPYIDSREQLRHVAVSPSLQLLDVRYDWTAGTAFANGVHAGMHVAGHLRPSTARERIYKRLWLFDPAMEVLRRGAISFAGATRLSMPAHHAELAIAIPGHKHPRAAGRYLTGYTIASDHKRYHDTIAGLRRVARASDRIAIDTATTRPLLARGAVFAGAAVAGEWRAIA